ncbi:hypothetical protein FKM82_022143 [Ascaphus truei]
MEGSSGTMSARDYPCPLPTLHTSLTMAMPGSHQNTAGAPNDQAPPQTVYLKALTVPLYQLTQQGCYQPPYQLATGSAGLTLDSANLSVIVNTQPPTIIQKPQAQTLTLNIVNSLPILSPGSSSSVASVSPGKSKNAGKHMCTHCGRDCLKPSVLEKHIRSHTGERPFPCSTCGIAFKTQSNLYKHRRTQTHVNNAKQSFDSDCGSSQEDKASGRVADDPPGCLSDKAEVNVCTDLGQCTQHRTSDTSVSTQENILSPVSGNDEAMLTHAKSLQSTHMSSGKTLGDHENASLAIVAHAGLNPRRMLNDQRSPMASRQIQLQRQQATYLDKQWDCNPSDRKLKKCESTDSGYLSHSDSADLQMFSGSPLHSLCESSIESEHTLNTGTLKADALHVPSVESGDKTSSSIGKKKLEEHISMLISQNKAVVDNRHLDNVRPRKTTLSKQGSIDLPMPYTFKDSFHFDIKSIDVNRKNVSLFSAKSTFKPLEKNRPLFFHSVPTQFSTTMDSMTVTRSNSLPFVESCRVPPDKVDIHATKLHGLKKQPLDPSFANLLLTNTLAAHTVDFSSSHPRALVRQTAVDEIQINNVTKCYIPEERKDSKKHAWDGSTPKCKAASKKGGQRKLNMFSHEKWQMYGDETFKKLYQKMQKNETNRKLKQEVSLPKSVVNSENNVQRADGAVLLSESLASPLRVSSAGLNSKYTFSSQSNLISQEDSINSGQELTQLMETQLTTGTLRDPSSLAQEGRTTSSGIHADTSLTNEVIISDSELKPQPLKKTGTVVSTDTDMPYAHTDFLEPTQIVHGVPVSGDLADLVITSHEGESNVPNVSNIEHSSQAGGNDSLQTPEKSPSERKKLKVEEMNRIDKPTDGTRYGSRIDGTGGMACEYVDISSLEPTQKDERKSMDVRRESDGIVTGTVDRQSLDKDNFISSPSPLSTPNGGVPFPLDQYVDEAAQASVPQSLHQSIGSIPALPEKVFTPRYLIKLHSGEPPLDLSTLLQVEQDGIFGISFGDTMVDLLNSTSSIHPGGDTDATFVVPWQIEPEHQHNLVDAVKVKHVHYSLTDPPQPSSSRTDHVPTGDSNISIHRGQAESQDTQGDNVPNDGPDERVLERQSTNPNDAFRETESMSPFYIGGFSISSDLDCPDQILQHQHLESSGLVDTPMSVRRNSQENPSVEPEVAPGSSVSVAVNQVTENTQELQDLAYLQPTAENRKSRMTTWNQRVHPMPTQDQGSSVQTTTRLSFPSGNTNVKATTVAFSSLNTESRPTWCCLNRSVPLPAEQKEKSYSVYSSLHCDISKGERPDSKLQAPSLDVRDSVTNAACTVSSAGNLKSLVSSLLWRPQKQKETVEDSGHQCPKSCSLEDQSHPTAKGFSSRHGAPSKSKHKRRLVLSLAESPACIRMLKHRIKVAK